MEEPKIVLALKKFIADYAWDKSLSSSSSGTSIARTLPPLEATKYRHTTSGAQALEEFINASRK